MRNILDLVSPDIVTQLEFGGPGSGRHPEGASGAAMEATQKANKLSEGDNHKAASDAHFAAATAHNAAMISAPNKHIEELHRQQAELHTKMAFEHAKAGDSKQAYARIEEPALSLLAFSGAAFVPVTQMVDPGGPNNVGTAKDGKNPAGAEALSSVKDVLSAGQYQHPIHGWKLDVTPAKMDKYCAAFSEMQAGGVKVPIYADHKPGAATTLGYCRAMFRGGPEALKKYPELAKLTAEQAPLDPNKMYAIHDWNSPEAMKMGHGVGQVSVLIDKKMKDGTGKSYGEAVRHVAVTPEPIVPGQGGFTQLAASLLNESKTGLYAFAKDAEMDDDEDDDAGKYPDHKKAASKAADKAHKGGGSDEHVDAAMAHKKAGDSAPSPEEKKAHMDCAADHFRAAARAVQGEAQSPEEKKAQDIRQTEREKAAKNGNHYFDRVSALASPAVLAMSRTEK